MKIRVMEEAGYYEAIIGMSLSHYDGSWCIDVEDWYWFKREERAHDVARKLAPKDGGHNKFLRAMQVWILVEAPRYWWQEFDQYKVGVTSLSASTMHTLSKRPPEQYDFAEGTPWRTMVMFYLQWRKHQNNVQRLKQCLPESFMQTRVVNLNYMTLREIIKQRSNHRLPEWQTFIRQVREQVKNPELLPKENEA